MRSKRRLVHHAREIEAAAAVAPTYVPNRTMIMLASTAALSCPDCREPFLVAAEQTLRLITEREFRILGRLIGDGKPAVVRCALELGAPGALTWTCYLGEQVAATRATPASSVWLPSGRSA